MNKSAQVVSLIMLLAVGAAAWHTMPMHAPTMRQSVRQATLSIKQHAFDEDGAVIALVAEATSADGEDLQAELVLYWTVPGESEEVGASAQTQRLSGDPDLHLSYALPVSEFPSGTALRAVFLIKDHAGNPTLTTTRTSSIP